MWLLRGIVFVALFGLAVKNSGPVDLRFYLDGVWQAPLSLVILTAFAVGAAVGLTATVMTLMRQGRELKRLRGRVDDQAPADTVDTAGHAKR
jgi:lipopolysaccharide assembly protein A